LNPEELIERILSSPFVDETLIRTHLGGDRQSIEAATRYLGLATDDRPSLSHLLDRTYYLEKHLDVAAANLDPLIHFFDFGCREGRSPHPLIDLQFIRSIDPHLLPEDADPTTLYDVVSLDMVDPSPYFSLAYYRSQQASDTDLSNGLLLHFLMTGLEQGRKPNPLFDPDWYYRQLEGEQDPWSGIRHFVLYGDRAGLAPSAGFSGRSYLARYADVAQAGQPALAHYLMRGEAEGRQTRPEQISIGATVTTLTIRDGALPAVVDAAEAAGTYRALRESVEAIRQEEKDAVSVTEPDIVRFEDPLLAIERLALPSCEHPTVSILVPIYNDVAYTAECVASIIRSAPSVGYEVVIADDGSTDPDVARLGGIENVRFIVQPVNLGFLRNCNAAFDVCRGRYVLLLNNDAQLLPGALDALVAVLDANGDVAAVGPKILYPNGRLQEAGCAVDRDGVTTMVGLFADPDEPRYSFDRDVHYCSGAALLVRRDELSDALFDEAFMPAYCEDVDLCLRLISRGRRVIYCSKATVVHHLSVSANRDSVVRRLQTVVRNQQSLTRKWTDLLEKINKARLIAFYLPQFHTTPENDFHWGQGFTEWTNVVKATPAYNDHHQPHLPADLGYYDLRVTQTFARQAALARRYGIAGFCVYYYNFGRRRALHEPFEAMVADRSLDFPYCVCWANENWTRHWDGGTRALIFEQLYDRRTLETVIGDAVTHAADRRYLRVDGKPLFLVYRPLLIPDPAAFAAQCRTAFRRAGFPDVHLVYVESMESVRQGLPPADIGFDACVEFPPHGNAVAARDAVTVLREGFSGVRYDYEATLCGYLSRPSVPYKRYPGVFPSWDNTPRQSQRGDSFVRATPEAFQIYVEEKLEEMRNMFVGDERLMFVNAWNEWAEGAHLEPDIRLGHRWLEAIRNALVAKSLA
jgi:GT2 family glycosyltransferase